MSQEDKRRLVKSPNNGSWQDLAVWQKAHSAVVEDYRVSKGFPSDERFRLIDQLCRAAASVPTNIAEGKGRGSPAEFRQFLLIARGSTEETRYLLRSPMTSASSARPSTLSWKAATRRSRKCSTDCCAT
ncbi:four helix bundle protein [Congregicoccus parvus]|uniref:four helix bundle protein n=1 Tax=Congregicoccus parvus TaxID=3081749 RepID=UPI003FA5B495